MISKLADRLWGEKGQLQYLLFAALVLIFTFLGSREIWTQEHRWADIVSGMFFHQDYFHPYLGDQPYYDKPLLSYWLIILCSKVLGQFNSWALRLPSALAGLIAIISVYQLGTKLKNKQLGLLAGWLLLTTFYFLFWARVSSADMLNLAGITCALAWYFSKEARPTFINYAIFFIILALTSLCKGLIGAIIPLLAVFIHICLKKSFWKYFSWQMIFSIVLAMLLYLSPFIASTLMPTQLEHQNGLYLVYRENFLRFFSPFDHQGAIYTYFLYLPLYLLPWTLLFVPALLTLPKRFQSLSLNAKWLSLSVIAIFVFFTLSGSRRSYYILPMLPFCSLFIADWLLMRTISIKQKAILSSSIAIMFGLMLLFYDVFPAYIYQKHGAQPFAKKVIHEAELIQPWSAWNVMLLDAETKLNFYFNFPPTIKNYYFAGGRALQTPDQLLRTWPFITDIKSNTIIITRQRYLDFLTTHINTYKLVQINDSAITRRMFDKRDAPIALLIK